ncbi:MAG: hypothetical protein HRT57_07655 [Crocinitomicaceae bacterium]|nr:hypothetical protein [Crocinitomicaceae bacterium]
MSDRLKNMQTDKLVDVAKNYAIYGYDESIRDQAITLLSERGVQTEDLIYFGKDKSRDSKHAEGILKTFDRNSILGVLCYVTFLCQLFIQPTEENVLILTLGRISTLILYVIFLIGVIFSIVRFNKAINKGEATGDIIILIVLGIPFAYLHFKRKMKEDLAHINS